MSDDRPSLDLERWRGLDATARRDAIAALGDLADAIARVSTEIESLARADPAQAAADAASLADTLAEVDDAPDAARADLLRLAAAALANLGRHDTALETLDAARDAAGVDSVALARIAIAAMQPLAKLGRIDEAIEGGTEACDRLEAAGRRDLAARGRFNLANLHKLRGDHDLAIDELDRAMAELGGVAAIAATIDNTRGESLLQLDRIHEAREAFDRSITTFRAAGGGYALAMATGNLGDLDARCGRFHEGMAAFDTAITAMRTSGADPQAARLEVDRAALLQTVGLHEEAADAATRLLPALSDLPAESSRAWIVIARAALRRRDGALATEAAEAAIRTAGTLEPWRTEATLLAAESSIVFGDGGRARTVLAAMVAAPVGIVHRVTHARLTAMVAIAEGRIEDAITAIDGLDRDVLPDWIVAETSLPAIDALALAGRLEEAIDRARAASAAIDAGRASLRTDRLRTGWTGGRIEVHLRLMSLLLRRRAPGDLEEALLVGERSRSRILLEQFDRAIGEDLAGDPELAAWRAELEGLLSRLDDDARGGDADRRRASDAIAPARLVRIRDLQRRIDDRLDAGREPLGDDLAAPDSETSGTATSTLADDEAVLVMLPTGREIALLLLRRDSIEPLPTMLDADAMQALADAIRFDAERWAAWGERSPAATRRLDAARRRLRTLHDRMIAPMHDALDDVRRIWIVPTGPMHLVPMHAALDTDDRVLGETIEVSVVPSLAIRSRLLRGRSTTTAAPRTFVAGVADDRAPRIALETDRIAELWGITPCRGDAATIDRVSEGLADATIAHVACHGRFEPAAPQASGLRLADGWLTLRRLIARRLDLDLLVLSGCETARGHVVPGDEVVGLPQAALRAGARSVVSALWSVPDEAATTFMIALHDALRAHPGARVSDSIRHARRVSRAESPHPAGWAAFQVHGV